MQVSFFCATFSVKWASGLVCEVEKVRFTKHYCQYTA